MNAPESTSGTPPRLSPLVARISGEGSEAWEVHSHAVKRQTAGDDVILLTIGDPDFDTPSAIVEATVDELRAGNTHYAGLFGGALRAAIARYQSDLSGRDISPGEVTPLLGAQNALFSAALCLFGQGDEVIVPEPAYVTYEGLPRSPSAPAGSCSTSPTTRPGRCCRTRRPGRSQSCAGPTISGWSPTRSTAA